MTRDAGYIGTRDDLFALQHQPSGPPTGTAVLIVPPFGLEAVAARRALRAWAERLAGDGHLAVRIDLPGTGDGAGDATDPALFERWIAAITDAAAVMAATEHVSSVAAIGVGLGGLLVLEAVRAGAEIDELVLWGTPRNGRRAVRELQAFGAFEDLPQPEGGGLLAGGYLMTPETQERVAALDPARWPEHALDGLRVMLIGAEGEPEGALAVALQRAGAVLVTVASSGYRDATAIDGSGRLPAQPPDRAGAWLTRGAATAAPVLELRERALMQIGEARVRESPVSLPVGAGRALFGVRCEPADEQSDRQLLFLNAGRIDHTGPNRLWVKIGRDCAARGIVAIRVDSAGIGESPGDDDRSGDPEALYREHHIEDVAAALEAAGGGRAGLVGLCAGGAWALRAAQLCPRVDTVVAINPRAIFEPEARGRQEAALRVTRVTEARAWRHLWRDRRIALRLAWETLIGLFWMLRDRLRGGGRRRRGQTEVLLETLAARGADVTLAFSGSEPLDDECRRDGLWSRLERWPGIERVSLDLGRERHELRPLALQRRAIDLVAAVAGREPRRGI